MKKYLVFDVESIGLHGEGYAVGGVLYDHQGWELSEFRFACLPEDAKGDGNGRDWVKANAPAIPVTHASPREMRSAFWEVWMKAKKDGAVLVADCGWPVEARFLAACVDDDHTERAWQGPYPMHEAASFLEAAGMDCLGTYEREENEMPVHDPLADARQTGRLLFDVLAKPPLRPAPEAKDYEDLRQLRRLACKAWRHDLTRQQALDALHNLKNAAQDSYTPDSHMTDALRPAAGGEK